jgi:uncharacterized protein (DUF305 family)
MNRFTPSRLRALALSCLVLAAALVATGCGSSNTSSSSAGNGVDLAFASQMIPHHTSAIAMAKIAQQRTTRPDIKTLAGNIVSSQGSELKTLQAGKAELEKAKVTQGDLGIAAHAMGMDMNNASLKTANPFDRAFIDMMVPHHQGAVRMARVELAKGASPTLKRLAQQIIAAQAREIGQMNGWRARWYGAASPAGGVPADGA